MTPSRPAAAPRVALAVAVVAVLVADGIALVALDGRTRAPAPVADDASPLARALPRLQAFVEEARGLRFKRRVPVELLSADAFAARLRHLVGPGDDEEVSAEDESFEAFLRVLGLVTGDVDLAAVRASAEERGILGFYDPADGSLFLRGTSLGPFEELVLVHELTHAVEDQHFGLDRPDLDRRDDESSDSFLALVEGSAVLVEQRFLASLPPEQRRVAEEGEAAAGQETAALPEVVDALLGYPYRDGPAFVERILAAGGQARLDAALAEPPTTSEQVLHPERYLDGEGPKAVDRPRADGPVEDSGVLGERVLALVLGEAVGATVARRGAAGWGGDRYVLWSSGGRTCIRWNLVMDSPSDTAELLTALRAFTARNRRARLESTGPVVTLSNCA